MIFQSTYSRRKILRMNSFSNICTVLLFGETLFRILFHHLGSHQKSYTSHSHLLPIFLHMYNLTFKKFCRVFEQRVSTLELYSTAFPFPNGFEVVSQSRNERLKTLHNSLPSIHFFKDSNCDLNHFKIK